ncbi:MAG: hypothetical protein ABW318_18160 [Vicinamibacterales bacterium]
MGTSKPTNVRALLRRVALVLLAIATAGAAASTFEYAGLRLDTDPSTFRQRYPTSTVDATSVQVSKGDAHDNVRYVRRWTNVGKDELNVLFEVPAQELDKTPTSFGEEHYARHPRCAVIFERLTKAYGKPAKTRTWPEERLSHRVSTWTNAREEMSLDCYNVDGKGDRLAAELTIRAR